MFAMPRAQYSKNFRQDCSKTCPLPYSPNATEQRTQVSLYVAWGLSMKLRRLLSLIFYHSLSWYEFRFLLDLTQRLLDASESIIWPLGRSAPPNPALAVVAEKWDLQKEWKRLSEIIDKVPSEVGNWIIMMRWLMILDFVISHWWFTSIFLVACYATLQPALSVRPSVHHILLFVRDGISFRRGL